MLYEVITLYRITKPFPVEVSKEMLIGTAMHKILESGWEDNNTAYKLVDEMVAKYGFTKSDKVNMSFMVDMFFLNFSNLVSSTDMIEHNFKLKLYEDVFLVGKMDRISNGNVIDWKSGKVAKNVDNDVQCMIYDFAYTKLFGNNRITSYNVCYTKLLRSLFQSHNIF